MNSAHEVSAIQSAPRARKRIYWAVPIVLAILSAAAAYWAVLEDAKADLHANRLEAQVQEYLSSPPEELFPNHEENRKRARADRDRKAYVNRTLGIEEAETVRDDENPYHGLLDEARAREVEAIKQHRETSRFIESVIERDVESFEIRITAAARRTLMTSELTKHLFREPKLEEHLEWHHQGTLPIVGGIAGFLWGMAICWGATYPSLGWRRLAIVLAVLGLLVALVYPSERITPLDRVGASIGFAVIPPLFLLFAREVILWIMRGFRGPVAIDV